MKVATLVLYICTSICVSCQNSNSITKINSAPTFQEKDHKYANIFKLLNGTWKGKFFIYEDNQPMAVRKMDLQNISMDNIRSERLKKINEIEVTQVYQSLSPYFQRVTITDYYPDSQKTEVSKGVNKIENGAIWCVIHKPNEIIVHKGSAPNDHTLIWQRNENKPQRIEYFLETVSEQVYEIIGYGYYEGHNIKKTPLYWFHGKYERQ